MLFLACGHLSWHITKTEALHMTLAYVCSKQISSFDLYLGNLSCRHMPILSTEVPSLSTTKAWKWHFGDYVIRNYVWNYVRNYLWSGTSEVITSGVILRRLFCMQLCMQLCMQFHAKLSPKCHFQASVVRLQYVKGRASHETKIS